MLDILKILKKVFGYSSFRKGQEEIITEILSGRDAVGIMPTGAGKSLCYQIPALSFDGVTVVISPLISLMKDQVDALRENGVNAETLNSSLDWDEVLEVLSRVRKGKCKILYIAPERLENEFFLDFLGSINLSFVVVDEAHCVSQWGHDFRPSYLKIAPAISSLAKQGLRPRPVVAAFTATATPEVQEDIVLRLELKKPFELTTGFDRANLFYQVERPGSKSARDAAVLKYIKEAGENSGIIYCSTRKEVERLCDMLRDSRISAVRYHAGLGDGERTKNQDAFLYDRAPVIVATNAFGMGIDKSNVRYVLHNNMPKNIDSYYQEAGRAGRDGHNADCVLFYMSSDVSLAKYFIDRGDPFTKKSELKKLDSMVSYCNTSGCLRKHIINYFGDEAGDGCENCANCTGDVEKTDVSITAKKILSCIYRMQQKTNGRNFGGALVISVLRGSKRESVTKWGFGEISTYGISKELSKAHLNEVLQFLVADGYVAVVRDENEYAVLAFSQKSLPFLKSNEKLMMRKPAGKVNEIRTRKSDSGSENEKGLFEALRALRRTIAGEEGVPPFVVFSDNSLWSMCKIMPRTDDEFLDVTGVGHTKLARYGERFIEAIREYSD